MKRRAVTASVTAVAAVVAVVAAAVVSQPAASWQARVEGRLVPRERTPYVQEVLGRTAVVLTFAHVVGDATFTEDAAAAAGIPADRLRDVEVTVRADPGSSVLALLVTGSDRDVVARLATGLVPAAAGYLDRVAPLYRLEPGAVGEPRQVSPGLLRLAGRGSPGR